MRKKEKNTAQLSLFEEENTPEPSETPTPTLKPTSSVLDFARKRFEQNPNMDQEEYRRWIRFLVNASIKRME